MDNIACMIHGNMIASLFWGRKRRERERERECNHHVNHHTNGRKIRTFTGRAFLMDELYVLLLRKDETAVSACLLFFLCHRDAGHGSCTCC